MDVLSLYNKAPCGLFTFHADGKIVHVNETLLTWLNAGHDEVINHDFASLDKGGRIYYQLLVLPLLRLENEVNEISFHISTDKCSFPCLFNARLFQKDADGGLLFAATICKVSDRKRYEEELLRKKSQADEEKKITTDALMDAAFDQSHLVRAPLANILGLITLLEDMEAGVEVRNIIELLRTSVDRLDIEVTKIADKLNA